MTIADVRSSNLKSILSFNTGDIGVRHAEIELWLPKFFIFLEIPPDADNQNFIVGEFTLSDE